MVRSNLTLTSVETSPVSSVEASVEASVEVSVEASVDFQPGAIVMRLAIEPNKFCKWRKMKRQPMSMDGSLGERYDSVYGLGVWRGVGGGGGGVGGGAPLLPLHARESSEKDHALRYSQEGAAILPRTCAASSACLTAVDWNPQMHRPFHLLLQGVCLEEVEKSCHGTATCWQAAVHLFVR